MKKIISILLSFVMLLSVAASLSLSAYADSQRTVSLDAGKGTVASTSIELNADGTLSELPVPTRTGWEFVGWYSDTVEENYWGDNEGEDGIEALKAEYGKYFPGLSDAEFKEMLFSWIIVSDGEEVNEGETLEDGVTTLYAKYKPTTVTVRWHLNGWYKEDGIALTAYPQYDSPITALDLTEGKYAWEKHVFEGWFDAAKGGNEWVFSEYNGCSTQVLTGDLDLYAHWSGGDETDEIQIRRGIAEGVHPGEEFTLSVWYNGITDKSINKPMITWEYDEELLELVSVDDRMFTFKASEKIDVTETNKLLTLTAHTANGLEDSLDITVCHNWNNGTVEKEMCIETVVRYNCTYDGCDAERLVSVPGTVGEHTVVKDSAVAPTCTETGKTEGSHCSVCGEIIVAQETVPTIDHNFGEWTEKDGKRTRSCKTCGYEETEPLSANGEPTVNATGASYVIGSGSGASIHLSSPIDELADVYVNGKPVDKANYTLSEDGTVLTFTSEYLDSLGTGEYEVTLVSASGSVTTELTVKNANGETTSPSTGADKGALILEAIAFAGGAMLTVKKKEQE